MDSISVLITTHNRHAELRRALASVFAQTRLPLEVVVVDDGSTPPVELDDLPVPRGLPLRLFRYAAPAGSARARNIGVAAAAGAWIAFLDDVDEFKPGKIAVVSRALARLGDTADLLYHPTEIVLVNEGLRGISRPPPLEEAASMYRALLVRNVVGGAPAAIVRKRSLLEHGAFDATLGPLEDYELWLRLARGGARFHLLPAALTRYHCVTAKAGASRCGAAGLASFAHVEAKYRRELDTLAPDALLAHREWVHETGLVCATLALERFQAMKLALALLLRFRRAKHAAALAASLLGPRAVIRLRARALL